MDQIKKDTNKYIFSRHYHSFQPEINEFFNKVCNQYGYDSIEISFIEAILFLTMIPLHMDSVERQIIFYLKAVHYFNEFFTNKTKNKNNV